MQRQSIRVCDKCEQALSSKGVITQSERLEPRVIVQSVHDQSERCCVEAVRGKVKAFPCGVCSKSACQDFNGGDLQ